MEASLASYLEVMPNLKNIIQEDIGVAISDKEKFIAYWPSDAIDLKTKIGDHLKTGEALYRTISTGKGIVEIMPDDIYGVPFKAITYPIRDKSGDVIGAIGLSQSLEKQKQLELASGSLFTALEDTTVNVLKVNEGMQGLFERIEKVNTLSKHAEQALAESENILKLIKAVSKQSNMLGLNAAIEASRAGDSGRGFSVVAEEMRRLAAVSSDSSVQVSDALMAITNALNAMVVEIHAMRLVSETQVEATESISASLEEITSSAEVLADLSQIE